MRKKGIRGIRKRIADKTSTGQNAEMAAKQNGPGQSSAVTASKENIMSEEIIRNKMETHRQNLEKVQSNILSAKDQMESLASQIEAWATQKNVLKGAVTGLQEVLQEFEKQSEKVVEMPAPEQVESINNGALKQGGDNVDN